MNIEFGYFMCKQQYDTGIIIAQRHSPKRFTEILQFGVITNHINVLKALVEIGTLYIYSVNWYIVPITGIISLIDLEYIS